MALGSYFNCTQENPLWNALKQACLLVSPSTLLTLEFAVRTYPPSAGYEFSSRDR